MPVLRLSIRDVRIKEQEKSLLGVKLTARHIGLLSEVLSGVAHTARARTGAPLTISAHDVLPAPGNAELLHGRYVAPPEGPESQHFIPLPATKD